MSKCEYDRVFYRVLCVTLLVIAFTFTIILTNVFVDIDGFIKGKFYDGKKPMSNNAIKIKVSNERMKPEMFYNDEKNYIEEIEDTQYRTKRSYESKDFLLKIKDPKVKNLIKDKLAKLLEEMAAEESDIEINNQNVKPLTDKIKLVPKRQSEIFDIEQPQLLKKKDLNIFKPNLENNAKVTKTLFEDKSNKINDNFILSSDYSNNLNKVKVEMKTNTECETKEKLINMQDENKQNDLLHVTMHNILLQGIIGHMELGDVYHRINMLSKSLRDNTGTKKDKNHFATQQPTSLNTKYKEVAKTEELKFLDELFNCKKLHTDINQHIAQKMKPTINSVDMNDPKFTIRTIIDVKPTKEEISDAGTERNNPTMIKNEINHSTEELKGLVKLQYNGIPINFKDIISKILNRETKLELSTHTPTTTERAKTETLFLNHEIINTNKYYINKLLSDYLKSFQKEPEIENNPEIMNNIKITRSKRQIHTDYSGESKKLKNTNKIKKGDEELYVEIETHFDNKSRNSEKRQKMVKSLIKKIQSALKTDIKSLKKNKKIHLHHHKDSLHVKKRIQNSIKPRNGFMKNKIIQPSDVIVPRQINPIGKGEDINTIFSVLTKNGDKWKKFYEGPRLFSPYKSINSGERGELDFDYKRVLKSNGLPQRLQLPINHEGFSDETLTNEYPYLDLRKMDFVLNDVDGTGLSIGFKQYIDEMPDPESIKLFTSLENLLKDYNSKYYNKLSISKVRETNGDQMTNDNPYAMMINRDDSHLIVRRSINDISNEILKNPYQSLIPNKSPYENNNLKHNDVSMNVYKKLKTMKYNLKYQTKSREPLQTDLLENNDSIFDNKLKSTEIFSIPNLLERKKRDINKKYQIYKQKFNLKHVIKRVMPSKRIFFKNRSKRQVDKIRIIATDRLPELPQQSENNIYVVSDESIFADRALIRDTTDVIGDKILDNYDPDRYDIISYGFEEPKSNQEPYKPISIGEKSGHSSLMSKYPHVFQENSANEYENEPSVFNQLISLDEGVDNEPYNPLKGEYELLTTKKPDPYYDYNVRRNKPTNNLGFTQETQDDNNLYKFTVKVAPKNISSGNVHSGFKEVHTSINKSFNKNGLMYYTHVNVSEISKVEKINTTTEFPFMNITESPALAKIRQQQERVKRLLRQHKDRIDQQLQTLHSEREHISHLLYNDTLERTKEENITHNDDLIDFVLPDNPSQILHLRKDEASQLLSTAFLKLQETSKNNFTNQASTTITTRSANNINLNTETTLDPIKAEMINTIKANKNLTSAILDKINQNTQILTTFLKKITDSLHEDKSTIDRRTTAPTSTVAQETANEFQDPQYQNQIFGQPLPNFDIRKNSTHVSIPFVYAYQHPYMNKDKNARPPIASVLYHGHIHANTRFTEPWQEPMKKIPEYPFQNPNTVNSTSFFLDNMQNYALPVKKIENGRQLNSTQRMRP